MGAGAWGADVTVLLRFEEAAQTVARLYRGQPVRNKDVAAALGLRRDHAHFLLRQALRHGLLEHERYRGLVSDRGGG